MLFSTVSISNRKYCLDICTLPGNWAMLENKAAYLITFVCFVCFCFLFLEALATANSKGRAWESGGDRR